MANTECEDVTMALGDGGEVMAGRQEQQQQLY